MRQLICIVLTALLAGCLSTEPLPEMTYSEAIDFREYANAGVTITPGDYGEDFTSIGYVSATTWPEARPYSTGDELAEGEHISGDAVYEEVNPRKAIDALVERAKAMGADAIIHFETQQISRTYRSGSIPGVRVSGFAIDRSDN